jgi:predicted peroxiredoxin
MAALPLLGLTGWAQSPAKKPLNILMKSAWGSDDPTKAAFPFLHGLALSEAGHSVQIFLLGEAVSLMRKSVAEAVVPVGWPPLEQTMTKIAERKVQIYACGACSRARSVQQTDLDAWGAKFGNPTIFVSLVEWADRIITE